jgi:hypothetical protein
VPDPSVSARNCNELGAQIGREATGTLSCSIPTRRRSPRPPRSGYGGLTRWEAHAGEAVRRRTLESTGLLKQSEAVPTRRGAYRKTRERRKAERAGDSN